MSPDWEVVAHPTGYWLVKAGRAVFAVPPPVGRALLTGTIPIDVTPGDWAKLHRTFAAALAGDDGPEKRLPPAIWLRLPLLPARLVQFLAAMLIPLAGKRGLIFLTMIGLAGYTHLGLTIAANPVHISSHFIVTTLVLFFLTAVWHELGHASALARQGYPPGGVGAGLLFVIPVLFADVTAVGALKTSGKLQVDVAGMAFQFGLGGILAFASNIDEVGSVARTAAWLALLAVVWSLFPFIKADGYWLVCDALGLADLESDPHTPASRRLRWFLRVYRLANVAFLLLVGIGLPLRYAPRISAILDHFFSAWRQPAIMGLLGIVGAAILGWVWFNIARRIVKLVRAAI